MKPKIGSIYGAALLTAVGLGVVLVTPDLPADRAIEQGKPTRHLPVPEEQERQLSTIQKHSVAQTRVVRAVIAGRLTLQQGAEELRDLHSVNPYFNWNVFREAYPGATDQGRCCRQLLVLIDIDLELARHPVSKRLNKLRLNCELER